MQLQGNVEKTGALPNLDEPEYKSQVGCERCQQVPTICYELFSAQRLVKGSRCAGCFLDLLRAYR